MKTTTGADCVEIIRNMKFGQSGVADFRGLDLRRGSLTIEAFSNKSMMF